MKTYQQVSSSEQQFQRWSLYHSVLCITGKFLHLSWRTLRTLIVVRDLQVILVDAQNKLVRELITPRNVNKGPLTDTPK